MVCEICGGSDFYQEAGFYYCNECLTQTQEMQEHMMDDTAMPDPAAIIEPAKRKSSKSSRSQEKKQQITSWECYNYIILGLVEELIQLGAKPELKPTVMNLWFAYLNKLEVLHTDPLEPPRLQPFNIAGDAEAIYGRIPRRKVKKRRKRARSESSGTTDYSNISLRNQNVLRGKKRRAMALSEYEERLSHSQPTNISLANQSLQSLRSDSDKSAHIKRIKFNSSAEQMLLDVMTREHFDAHTDDDESEMNCHFSRRKIPFSYANGPMILTRNKIYAIVYLGLLFVRDDIQLADMLRLIREGHVSYQYIDHFFPEDLANCELKLNKKAYSSANPILHHSTRETAYKLSQLLEVTDRLPLQNIVRITERYIAELNLPNEVMNFVLKLISRTEPAFKIPKAHPKIPNYEARVGSFIVFVLKLLYGLDDSTEFEMSMSARILNEKQNDLTYFDYTKWRDFIEYRRIIIGEYHFPSNHLLDLNCNKPDLYADFLSELMQRQQIDGTIHKDLQDVDHLLKKLIKNIQGESGSKEHVTFLPTLTPFKSYLSVVEKLTDYKDRNYDKKLLLEDFKEDSIDFIVHPSMHYPGKVVLQHKGANDNIQMIKMKYRKKLTDTDFYKVYLSIDNFSTTPKGQHDPTLDHLEISEQLPSKSSLKRNKNILKSCPRTSKTKLASAESEESFQHYLPEERLWINSTNMTTWDCHHDFITFFEKFPFSFQLLIREMARITEQTVGDFMEEYINVELFMKHHYDFQIDEKITFKKNPKRNNHEALNNVIHRVGLRW